ncbi:MAG: protein phosphatase 2C domain-containing protein [Gemmataceae bacterium]|uniref:Serine/threonine-protein phosphatase n=1 Tax=Thermogemmata fonticola TaxID=2755323 RepID=A0A7V8VFI8_9BACT|nr:protein phosphatase 2C domain-containing protein [Thermogemmata fonticola]MBA2227084.1 serine/threonine-protein phosphatase [Thermogemmata fonticola]MCX8138358.1 protein phosphatase 2C domain-containing protein [Gemmataceae bacterium]
MSAFEPPRYATLTDVGVKRSHNQDACAAKPAVDAATFASCGHIFIVADGMGGHAVGEKASVKAVRDIPHLYQKHVHEGVIAALRRAFAETNTGIHEIGQQNPEFRGMGTTSTALILRPEGAWIGHVGDSRAYRIRGNTVEQLTFDHSWVWEIARRTGVDPDELGDFKKNVIIRSLGPDPEVEVDIEGPHPVQPGDIFLLCSDGLTGLVKPEEIGAIVNVLSLESAVRLLVHLANLRGGPDNITVILVRVPGGPHDPGAPRYSSSSFTRLRETLSRHWPVWTILTGSVCALLSLFLHLQELKTLSLPLFLLGALIILVGIIGLVHSLLRTPSDTGEANVPLTDPELEQPRSLNIYRQHDCTITPERLSQFAETEQQLITALKEHNIPVDWEAHAQLAGAEDGDLRDAFRLRCEAILLLADAFHKARHKQESFQPSWTSPQQR